MIKFKKSEQIAAKDRTVFGRWEEREILYLQQHVKLKKTTELILIPYPHKS